MASFDFDTKPQHRTPGHRRIDPEVPEITDPAMMIDYRAAIHDHTLAQLRLRADYGTRHDRRALPDHRGRRNNGTRMNHGRQRKTCVSQTIRRALTKLIAADGDKGEIRPVTPLRKIGHPAQHWNLPDSLRFGKCVVKEPGHHKLTVGNGGFGH